MLEPFKANFGNVMHMDSGNYTTIPSAMFGPTVPLPEIPQMICFAYQRFIDRIIANRENPVILTP